MVAAAGLLLPWMRLTQFQRYTSGYLIFGGLTSLGEILIATPRVENAASRYRGRIFLLHVFAFPDEARGIVVFY